MYSSQEICHMEDGNNRKHLDFFYYQSGVKAVTIFLYKKVHFRIFKYFHHLIFQLNVNSCYEGEQQLPSISAETKYLHLNVLSVQE